MIIVPSDEFTAPITIEAVAGVESRVKLRVEAVEVPSFKLTTGVVVLNPVTSNVASALRDALVDQLTVTAPDPGELPAWAVKAVI